MVIQFSERQHQKQTYDLLRVCFVLKNIENVLKTQIFFFTFF